MHVQVRTDNVNILKKVFWGGGAVSLATSGDDFHILKYRPSEKFEDGTVAFLDIIALPHTFAFARDLGGVAAIQAHVHALTRHLFTRLEHLSHSSGAPLAEVFGRHRHPDAASMQGAIVNFEILDPQGVTVSYKLVEREAARAGFHVRTGLRSLLACAHCHARRSSLPTALSAASRRACAQPLNTCTGPLLVARLHVAPW
jgi:molybdenum cofactor sulfurtransferase